MTRGDDMWCKLIVWKVMERWWKGCERWWNVLDGDGRWCKVMKGDGKMMERWWNVIERWWEVILWLMLMAPTVDGSTTRLSLSSSSLCMLDCRSPPLLSLPRLYRGFFHASRHAHTSDNNILSKNGNFDVGLHKISLMDFQKNWWIYQTTKRLAYD